MTLPLGTYNVRVDNPSGLYDLMVNGFTVDPPATTLSGYVTNASNAQPIAGAIVSLGGITDTSDALGYYFLKDVPYGMLNAEFVGTPTAGRYPLSIQFTDLSTANTQTIISTASGYSDYTNNHVIVLANQDNILDIAMNGTIAAGQMRFVLTWDDNPSDLDSHMETPPIDGTAYHVYYSSKGDSTGPPYIRLDVDDVTGYGPETITVYDMVDGTYYYYI